MEGSCTDQDKITRKPKSCRRDKRKDNHKGSSNTDNQGAQSRATIGTMASNRKLGPATGVAEEPVKGTRTPTNYGTTGNGKEATRPTATMSRRPWPRNSTPDTQITPGLDTNRSWWYTKTTPGTGSKSPAVPPDTHGACMYASGWAPIQTTLGQESTKCGRHPTWPPATVTRRPAPQVVLLCLFLQFGPI